MRRHLAIATLVFTLLVAPVWCQRHGVSGGGVAIGRPGFVSRGPVMVNRGPMMTNRGVFIGRPLGARFDGNFRGRFFDRDRFFFDRFHRRHRLFFGFYPFFPGFYPGYDAYPAYYGDYSYPVGPTSYEAAYDSANAYSAPNTELENAVARLGDEVEQLLEERELHQALPPKPEPEKNSEPPESAVLVRDKHIQEVKN